MGGGNTCTNYPLTSCPEGGECSTCNTGTDIYYKLDSCNDGYYISDNSCIAKTCSDYGYVSLGTNMTCKYRYSVLLGAEYGYCYNLCLNCTNNMCTSSTDYCYTKKTTSLGYGSCITYISHTEEECADLGTDALMCVQGV